MFVPLIGNRMLAHINSKRPCILHITFTRSMVPRIRNRLLHCISSLRIVSGMISSSFATPCFYVHLSLHALTNHFVIHRIRKDPPLSLWTGHQPQSYTEAHHLPYLCSNSSRSPSSVIHPCRNHHFNPWKRTPATPTPPCPCRHPGTTVLEKDRESCCGKVSPRGTSFRFLPRICSKVCFKQFWHHKRILSVDFSAIMATSTLKESV